MTPEELLAAAKAVEQPSRELLIAIASAEYALAGKPIRPGNPNTLAVRLVTLERELDKVLA